MAREVFEFASPCEVLRAVKVYVGSHYGSNLWQVYSDPATQYYTPTWCEDRYPVQGLKIRTSMEVAVMFGVVVGDAETTTLLLGTMSG